MLYEFVIVAFVLAIGAADTANVAALVMVLAATKLYVGASNKNSRCVVIAPVAHCLLLKSK